MLLCLSGYKCLQTGSTCGVKNETRESHVGVRGVGMMDELNRRTQTSLCPRQTISVSTWLIRRCHGNRQKNLGSELQPWL